MEPGRGQAEDDVAGRDAAAVDDGVALDRAHGEARQIVVAARIHAGHLGGLAADQRAARLAAALGDAGDDGAPRLDVEPAGGEIVEEEQGLGALDDQIVDAHGDEVDADGIVAVEGDGDLELGADAVGGRDQDGIAIAGRLQVEQGAETAESRLGSASWRCWPPWA